MAKLLVIIPDRLSVLLEKGEITDRYYNPGNLFDHVHILMINNDSIDPNTIQRTVGTASLRTHNLAAGPTLAAITLGFRPFLLKKWAAKAVHLAEELRPDLVRCHGSRLNGYVAAEIKDALAIPYVLSMHTQPDENRRIEKKALPYILRDLAEGSVARIGIKNADIVLPVYNSIVPYVRRLGAKRIEVVYNAINPTHLLKKEDYTLSDPVRIICVGRQYREKNPENIIRAIARFECVTLCLIGDGAYHNYLKRVAEECGVSNRVEFMRAIPNDILCRMLPQFDIFTAHSDYCGIPKAVMEPLLTGLPVVLNKRPGAPVPEFKGDHILLVENTVDGYYEAFRRLIQDNTSRKQLGQRAYVHARKSWNPAEMEKRVVKIYKELLEAARSEAEGSHFAPIATKNPTPSERQ